MGVSHVANVWMNLYSLSWFVSVGATSAVYLGLSKLFPPKLGKLGENDLLLQADQDPVVL
jgi:cytosine/uracil/thiamine/allantoin permease